VDSGLNFRPNDPLITRNEPNVHPIKNPLMPGPVLIWIQRGWIWYKSYLYLRTRVRFVPDRGTWWLGTNRCFTSQHQTFLHMAHSSLACGYMYPRNFGIHDTQDSAKRFTIYSILCLKALVFEPVLLYVYPLCLWVHNSVHTINIFVDAYWIIPKPQLMYTILIHFKTPIALHPSCSGISTQGRLILCNKK